MSHCDTCMGEFPCGRLATALKVVGAMPDLAQHPRLDREYRRILAALESDGWAYPDGPRLCAIAKDPKRIARHTKDLIDAMRAERVSEHRDDTSESLLEEERRLD